MDTGTFNSAQFNNSLFGGPVQPPIEITSRSLSYDALRLLTVLRPGQSPNSETLIDCQNAANAMVDSWSTERLMIPAIERNVYDLIEGQHDYMIGQNLAFDNVRPNRIHAVALMDTTDHECPIAVSTERFGHPPFLYTDGGFPVSNIRIEPAPQAGYRLVMYTWLQFQMFADLDTKYRFPAGFPLAMRYNLAVQIAPMFATLMAKAPAVLLQQIDRQALEYKARIKSLNMQAPVLSCDPALTRRFYDVRTGRYW